MDGADPTEADSDLPRETRLYDRDPADPCSHTVVSAVATSLGCSPLDLEPLFDRLDPEALDALVGRANASGDTPVVTFEFAGCAVAATPAAVRVARTDTDD
ncbi:HalOD1 output domain-containing protein [Salinigranum marinum]|uniref:HalOD1 output domain-containing protein n=1 Tax=Salinigranum marinum TaxID=1515595 RepID=UPI002989FDAC|nr:HalOD1 output domain-containing protein [Salinigranum marinum]